MMLIMILISSFASITSIISVITKGISSLRYYNRIEMLHVQRRRNLYLKHKIYSVFKVYRILLITITNQFKNSSQ